VLFVLRPAGYFQSSLNRLDNHSPLTGESIMVVIPLPGWPDYKSFHSRWATWSFPLLHLKVFGFWLRCTLKFLFAPLNQIAAWITFSCFFEPMRIHWLRSLESILIPSAEIASPAWGCQLQCHWFWESGGEMEIGSQAQ